jgi:hypothetical protein
VFGVTPTLSHRLGIDFGTTHTVAVIETADGRAQPLLFDSSPLLSSAVYADTDGRLLTGRDGERSARLDPTRYEPNPKRRIDEATILLGNDEFPVPRVISAVLTRVAAEAIRATGGAPAQTVLTHPANWGSHRKDVLAHAAAAAGLTAVTVVPEPVAAAAHFTGVLGRRVNPGESLAVYDFGAGTFDASIVRLRPDGAWELVASEGLNDVGGLDLDAVLVDRIGRVISHHDPQRWHQLVNPSDTMGRRASRTFWDDVRAAKEQLSRTPSAAVHVPLFDTDTHLTREEFEAAARPLLDRTVELMAALVNRAGATRLAGLYLVGGSSRIPIIATLLHQRLGVAPTLIDQPELLVAQGSLRAVPAPRGPMPGMAPAGFGAPSGFNAPPPSGFGAPAAAGFGAPAAAGFGAPAAGFGGSPAGFGAPSGTPPHGFAAPPGAPVSTPPGSPVSAPTMGMPTSAVPAGDSPTTGAPVSGVPTSGGPPHDPLQPGVPLWGSTAAPSGPGGPGGPGGPQFGPYAGPTGPGRRRSSSGTVKWVLVAVVAFLVLAGGGAVAAVKLAGGDEKGGGRNTGSGTGNQGDPLGGGNEGGADTGTGGDTQPTGPAKAGQVTVNKTVWYGGKKFIINTASYDPTQDRPVSIDVKVENLSGEADNNARYTPTFLTYDGKTVQGRIGELDELLSKATSQAVITFDPDKPVTNLKAATLTIGEEASVQAKVPLGDPAKAVSLEPKQVADAKTFTAGLLDFKFTKCEHRADFPDRHDQAKSGSYLVYCVFDVKYTKTSGSNYFAAKEGFRLKLPDGTITSSQYFRAPLMDPQEQVRDVPIAFEIRWPAPGNYTLMVHDAGSYGQGQPGPGNLTEIAMTL